MKVLLTTQKCRLAGSTMCTKKSVTQLIIIDDQEREWYSVRPSLTTLGLMMITSKVDVLFKRRDFSLTFRLKQANGDYRFIPAIVEARSKLHAKLTLWAALNCDGVRLSDIYTVVKANADTPPDNV